MKKISAILICLLMLVTCSFAGCASFSINKVKYYNEVLAVVDETKITRYDLLSAYNSYGQQYYVQQKGQSEQEALNSTLDMLIDRELIYQYALDNNSLYKPTAYQINEVITELFSSLDEQMNSYVKTAKKMLNIKESENVPAEEKDSQTAYTLEDYTYSPRAFIKKKTDGSYYIEYNLDSIKEPQTYDCVLGENNRNYLTDFNNSNIVNIIKTEYFKHYEEELRISEGDNTDAILNKCRSLFAEGLINYEYYLRDANGKAYDKVHENLFTRYFDRAYKNSIKSQYLENVRTHFLQNEELKISLLETKFKDLMDLNYNANSSDLDTYKSKMKDIGTSADDVLYHPETDSQFGYFIHTLISFDDTIKNQLTSLDSYKGDDKEKLKENFIRTVAIQPRDAETGLIDKDATPVNLTEILQEYEDIRTTTYAREEEKLSAFINFMFKYTGDTATLSAGMPYVVGNNGNSAMEQAFTDEAVSLMENGKPGNMSIADLNTKNISDLCITSYGIHLIYYVGDVNMMDVNYDDIDETYFQSEDIEGKEHLNLYSKIINPLTKETYFDMMFDIVFPADTDEVYSSNNGYSEYEENIVLLSKTTHQVTKYTTKIKGTQVDI